MARPTVVTKDVLRKLEEAFALGCTDLEACLYADIGKSTLYDYQNANPSFLERKQELKENPVLIARTTVVKDIATNSDLAMKYLERKCKEEFSLKREVDNRFVNKDGDDLATEDLKIIQDYKNKIKGELDV